MAMTPAAPSSERKSHGCVRCIACLPVEINFKADLGAVGAEPPLALVVVDEEFKSVALVEGALVRHGVHEDERLRPADVGLQRQALALLQQRTWTV